MNWCKQNLDENRINVNQRYIRQGLGVKVNAVSLKRTCVHDSDILNMIIIHLQYSRRNFHETRKSAKASKFTFYKLRGRKKSRADDAKKDNRNTEDDHGCNAI